MFLEVNCQDSLRACSMETFFFPPTFLCVCSSCVYKRHGWRGWIDIGSKGVGGGFLFLQFRGFWGGGGGESENPKKAGNGELVPLQCICTPPNAPPPPPPYRFVFNQIKIHTKLKNVSQGKSSTYTFNCQHVPTDGSLFSEEPDASGTNIYLIH